ncbi:gamma-glutamyl-gamma-aminobutyrate hydrolase family protein [Mycolicibacterium sp.]|uniref:gamma-glutamyl-gamma-aminobutyrate hydrolase family protein n=1 Tax=Mycolicibacterium sp. TaxID=2320850 RepID=UPI003D148C4B
MGRPLIAVSTGREVMATAFGEIDCTKLTAAYTDAVYDAGGQPVIMPVVDNPPPGLLDRMDGLVLSGGGDIDPVLYGEAPDPSVYGIRRDRDSFEAALYRHASALGLPILAICRGMQLVNVLRGGTLLQQVPGHWQENPASRPLHCIDVAAGSALADATAGAAAVEVNSYHHQAIGVLGVGLSVAATCGEVIEAVEDRAADVVAVQWHPEHMRATPHQRALFEHFVKRAAAARSAA